MDFKDILKKYWFLGLVTIALLVYGIVYCVQAYSNRKIYVDAKSEDGKSIVYTLNNENYYADDLYSDLYDNIGQSATYFKWTQAVIRNAYKSDEDITSLANNYYSYIISNNEESTIDSSLKQSGYENGVDDLLDYCIDMVKSNKLYVDFYKANYDTYVPKIVEEYKPKKIYHILVKVADISEESDDDGNTTKVANMTDEEQAKLDSVLKALEEGKDFEEVAKEYSEDTSATSGGYLGIYDNNNASNYFVSEFANAVTSLEFDEVSEPVLSQYGYHIIKVVEPTKDELMEDDSFMSEISSYYTYANFVAVKQKSDELGITINDEKLNALIEDYLTKADEELNSSEESE